MILKNQILSASLLSSIFFNFRSIFNTTHPVIPLLSHPVSFQSSNSSSGFLPAADPGSVFGWNGLHGVEGESCSFLISYHSVLPFLATRRFRLFPCLGLEGMLTKFWMLCGASSWDLYGLLLNFSIAWGPLFMAVLKIICQYILEQLLCVSFKLCLFILTNSPRYYNWLSRHFCQCFWN